MEPITTYGAENWMITEKNHKSMEAVEIDFLQQASSVSVGTYTELNNRDCMDTKETIVQNNFCGMDIIL